MVQYGLLSTLIGLFGLGMLGMPSIHPSSLTRESAFAGAEPCDTIQSRRIAKLCGESKTDSSAETAFWKELAGHAPIHELIPPHNVGDEWATFVWRGDDSTASVALDADLPPPNNARYSQGVRALNQLRGTHVWYRTERLPFDFRLSYSFHVTRRAGKGVADESLPDPLNTGVLLEGSSVAAGLLAAPQPWLKLLPGVPKGQLRRDSTFSHFLGEERTITIYRPAESFQLVHPALVLVLDGERYSEDLSMPTSLDNLIAKGMIKPTVVVFVDTRKWNRQEDLACSHRFADFLIKEVVPILRKSGLGASAKETVLAGSSQGGLQSACTAFWYPKVVGNVLSLSGSYFWYPGWPAHETGLSDQTGWLTSVLAKSPREPLRWFLTTGTFEGDGVTENRRLRDVLIAKGYSPTYQEYSSGHDDAYWLGAIADGLITLLSPHPSR